MRWIVLVVLAASCASPRRLLSAQPTTSSAAVLPTGPTAALVLREPVALQFDRQPCPASPTPKGTIPNLFTPLPSPAGAVISVEKLSVPVSTVSSFSEDRQGVALSLLLAIPEGGGAEVLPALRLQSGVLVPVTNGLSEPFVLDGTPAGLRYGEAASFWHDGVCEVPSAGSLVGLRGAVNGEVVGLRTWQGHRDVVLRRTDGSWWSLGPIPSDLDVRPTTAGGRITLAWSRPSGASLTVGAQFPDVGRTELVRRYAAFPPRYLYGGVTPARSSWGPSRLSPPLMLDYAFDSTGDLTLERPAHGGGFERVLLTTLKPERGCDASLDRRDPKTSATRISQPVVVALDETRSVVAWVEERLTCRYEQRQRPEAPPCPQCPRAPPPPDEWVVKPTSRTMELVLLGADSYSRELARVSLPATLDEHSFSGVSLATRDDRLFVFANNYALVLDQKKLEAAW
ncbi:MAG: hypothetical protein GQE15_14060 [Archangiaceae bacterium]|nr:hypothetical protein [Archangiaceae bacterium]